MKRAAWFLAFLAVLMLGVQATAADLSWSVAASLLFWHYIAFALVTIGLIGVLVWKRGRLPVTIATLAVALSYGLPPISDFFANPQRGEKPSYKIISYNWLHSGADRRPFYEWLAAEKPDIISIQEFSTTDLAPLLASQPETYFVSKSSHDVVILSKYPLSRHREEKISSTRLVSATAALPSGPVRIFGIHAATLRDVELLKQRDSYLSQLPHRLGQGPEPRIAMGDFNATAWEPMIIRLKSRTKMHESPRLIPLSTRIAVRRNLDVGSPIDHIMASRSVHMGACRTGPLMSSDHRPLICEIAF